MALNLHVKCVVRAAEIELFFAVLYFRIIYQDTRREDFVAHYGRYRVTIEK